MARITIINHETELDVASSWVDAAKFNSKDRLVDENGLAAGLDYTGRTFKIILKKEREFSDTERFGRNFLGVVAIIFSFGLVYFLNFKPVMNLLTKHKENIRYALLFPLNQSRTCAPLSSTDRKLLDLLDTIQSTQDEKQAESYASEALSLLPNVTSLPDSEQSNRILTLLLRRNDASWYSDTFPNLQPKLVTAIVQRLLSLKMPLHVHGAHPLLKMCDALLQRPIDHPAIKAFFAGFPSLHQLSGLKAQVETTIGQKCYLIVQEVSFRQLLARINAYTQGKMLQAIFAFAARASSEIEPLLDHAWQFDSSLHRSILDALSYTSDARHLAQLCAHELADKAFLQKALANNPADEGQNDHFFIELIRSFPDDQNAWEWLIEAVFSQEAQSRQEHLFMHLNRMDQSQLAAMFHCIPPTRSLKFDAQYEIDLMQMAVRLLKKGANPKTLSALAREIAASRYPCFRIIGVEDQAATQVLDWVIENVLKDSDISDERRAHLLKQIYMQNHREFLAKRAHQMPDAWIKSFGNDVLFHLADAIQDRHAPHAPENFDALARGVDFSHCDIYASWMDGFWSLFNHSDAKQQADAIALVLEKISSKAEKLANASIEAYRHFGVQWKECHHLDRLIPKLPPLSLAGMLEGLAEQESAAEDDSVQDCAGKIKRRLLAIMPAFQFSEQVQAVFKH